MSDEIKAQLDSLSVAYLSVVKDNSRLRADANSEMIRLSDLMAKESTEAERLRAELREAKLDAERAKARANGEHVLTYRVQKLLNEAIQLLKYCEPSIDITEHDIDDFIKRATESK
jgi:hypothetical protein